MSPDFAIIACVTVCAAVAAMGLRNLVHCALSLAVALTGLAAAYVRLDAPFVGFAQVLVYVGAVAIVMVFAILLTRGGEPARNSILSPGWPVGVASAGAVLAVLVWSVSRSAVLRGGRTGAPDATVRRIGDVLMHRAVLPLEVLGLLLTAALIGAVIIAMHDKAAKPEAGAGGEKRP